MTTRRDLLRMAVVGASGILLSACASTPAAPTETSQPAATAPTATAAPSTKPAEPTATMAASTNAQLAPAKLVWWTNDGKMGDRVKPIEAEFMKSHPQITVEDLAIPVALPEKLAPAAAAGTLPDLYYARTFTTADHSTKGWLADITDLVKRDAKEVNVDDLEPLMTVKEQWKGKWYSLPENYSVIVAYYNKNLFDEVKVPYPKDDWTWNDFLQIGKQFIKTDASGKQSRFGADTGIMPNDWVTWGYLKGDGGEVFSPDLKKCVINSKENVAAMQFLGDLINVHKVAPAPGQLPQGQNPFFSGLSAMHLGGSWEIPGLRDGIKDKFDWDVAALPRGASGKYGVNVEGGCYGISSTKNKDQTWELLKFAASNHGINVMVDAILFSLPGRISNRDSWLKSAAEGAKAPKHSPVFFDMLKNVPPMVPALPYWEEVIKSFDNRVATIISGEAKAADVIPALEDELNKIIAKYTF
jgi:multiple sugar transport system substrate-binding protein